jgi:hypothetical protein
MHRNLRASLLASALILSAVPFAAAPAMAQVGVSVSFNDFHDKLSAYGTWSSHPRYGNVWRPSGVEADFHPYSRGHWVNTEEYGFTWVSDYKWGDVPFHYGRWVNDPDEGWLWVPGYVWAPAWVSWRSDNDYTGWAPLPPDDRFLAGDETEFDIDPVAYYGPRFDAGNIYVFVGTRHVADPNFRTYIVQRPTIVNIFRSTRNITRISVVNDHVVNRSVDVRIVERAGGRRIPTVSIRTVLKPGAVITNVRVGREIDVRETTEHPRFHPGSNNNNGNNGHGDNNNDHGNNNGHDNDHGNGNGSPNDHGNNNDHGNGMNNEHGGDQNGSHTDTDHNDNNKGADKSPDTDHKTGTTMPGGTATPADNNGANKTDTGQTPKHKKSKDATPADQGAPSTGDAATPSGGNAMSPDNGAMGGDQTPKHHKAKTTDDSMSGSGAMTSQPSGNAPPTDNGANNMGTNDQTPKHHKAMPADQSAPPSGNNGASGAAPGQGGSAPAATAPSTDNSAKPKKAKKKPDDQSDNTTQ